MHVFIKRFFRLKQIDKLGVISFFTTLGAASVGAIWSVYLESYLHNLSYLGFLSTLFTFVSIWSFIFLIPMIQRYDKAHLYKVALLAFVISYFCFAFLDTLYAVIFFGVVISVMASLKINSFGIIVADKSKRNKLSENEGWIYTIMNLSWMVGPLIAGFLAGLYGVKSVFLLGAGFLIFALLFMKGFSIKDGRKAKKSVKDFFIVVRNYFRCKDRALIYVLSGGISLWWAFIYIFGPVYIVEHGFNASFVGIFLFGVAFPLVFLESYFGKLAGRIGFKKLFFAGYLITGLAALACFFTSNFYVLFALMILASIGIAMLEPTTEAYFFDILSKEEVDEFYGIYNTTIEVFYMISTFLAGLILMMFKFEYLFLLFGAIPLVLALLSLRIKNVIESRRSC